MNDTVVLTRALRKSFRLKGHRVEAVRGLDLNVHQGEIFGFLGPNGAGKTTTLRMLTTLLPIDAGQACVAGIDVVRQARQVRRRIGYVGQLGGADTAATGRENLLLQGQLYGLSRSQAKQRADQLVERLDLADFIHRLVRTYSGGQKRRLEVALGIMHRPVVLFLDEPTTGLDPQNRANMWEQVRQLRDGGTTIFLTTHYLEEADALSDRVAIMDHGQLVAEGTPRELKLGLGGETITLKPRLSQCSIDQLRAQLEAQPVVQDARLDSGSIRLTVRDGSAALPAIVALLKSTGTGLETITLAAPSLDDVFLRQTGRSLHDTGAVTPEPGVA